MRPDTLGIVRSPEKRESLRLTSVPGPDGRSRQFLASIGSGKRFPLRDGIPVFLDRSEISGPNLKYQELYDRLAPIYDISAKLYAYFKGGGEEKRRREYLGELEIEDGDRVLEVSIGTGANVLLLPPSAEYFGVDISWAMLRRCQKKARKLDRHIELFFASAESLPFVDDAFDVVFHVGGINFFSDKAAAVQEMIRVANLERKLSLLMRQRSSRESTKRYLSAASTSEEGR